jgi:hypothetical protein
VAVAIDDAAARRRGLEKPIGGSAGVPTRSRVGRAGIATPSTLFANNAVAFHIPAGVPVRADMMAEET